jgi:hypothetical protein
VYHKAVMDKKSPGTLARLAKQAGAMYSEVSAIFNQPTVVQHFERSWVAHTKMKVRSNVVKLGQTWSNMVKCLQAAIYVCFTGVGVLGVHCSSASSCSCASVCALSRVIWLAGLAGLAPCTARCLPSSTSPQWCSTLSAAGWHTPS